jgi:hypothetical protein
MVYGVSDKLTRFSRGLAMGFILELLGFIQRSDSKAEKANNCGWLGYLKNCGFNRGNIISDARVHALSLCHVNMFLIGRKRYG